jgi:protein CpxP
MRKVTAAVMASTLAFSAFSQAAVAIISDNGPSRGRNAAQQPKPYV